MEFTVSSHNSLTWLLFRMSFTLEFGVSRQWLKDYAMQTSDF